MSKSVRELRELFLSYFESQGHRRIRSSALIPHNDPTLLFTNAGMVQFKDYFTGKEKPKDPRATTCQKCVRAGGKHNDLESVGRTKRHHTFFEMLGNFSFGDYFKEKAIEFAWEFLTEKVSLPKNKLWVSVFRDDDEAFDIWTKQIGVPKDRVVRMDEASNFWGMGDTGPCGPCTEIHFDRGESFGEDETIFDGGERFLEIWNLVFMQFERFEDGKMIKLPKPSVDTGMGLERLASVVQNVDSNYDTDGMQSILQGFAKITGKVYGKNLHDDVALKVLTDHIRACTFLISDGVQPGNEGRSYVLRRILRRAIRFGKNLGCERPFFYQGVAHVIKEMGEAYPELVQNQAAVTKIVQVEEEKFFETLESGLKLLEERMKGLRKSDALDGAVAFQLYDTFGFPLDLTEMILEERQMKLDHKGFEKALEEQRERSRKAWKGSGQRAVEDVYRGIQTAAKEFKFVGYEKLKTDAKIVAILNDGKEVNQLSEGDEAEIIIDQCPFYAESGGQVGDKGSLESSAGIFRVEDCQKPVGSFHSLIGKLERGQMKSGDAVSAKVDENLRRRTRIHHTMTHVMHWALQKVLGGHIKQAGSLVGPDYLRFDFSHFQGVSKDELRRIESLCNQKIWENPLLDLVEEDLEKAIASGAKAFFEDKYSDRVRVLRIGDFSIELCGGTHAKSLAEAGVFKIIQESSVASGVRRIVAVTGEAAYDYILEEEAMLDQVAEKLKAPKKELNARVEKLLKERAELQKKLGQKSTASSSDFESLVKDYGSVAVLIELPKVENSKDLRPIADDYKNRMKTGVVLLGALEEGKATVVVSVSKDLAERFKTTDLVRKIGEALGGKGGGRSDFAQVGGPKVEALNVELLENLTKKHIEGLKLS
ncbi:MAG: alanine--tRNA ligase [Deltaproteobacteria bacterium CG11_big_fil_rev_8_21_14_0_20_45_16]|nr:MAG: alanine--tRNA ligase [Deltaproteobacteria bacterium CG11_big_fil_rev_8_21_14_0_20_45_16]